MLVGTSLKPKSAVAAGEDFQGEVAIMKRKNRATWLHLPRSVDCDEIAVKDACSAKTVAAHTKPKSRVFMAYHPSDKVYRVFNVIPCGRWKTR
jgi:hypothetical protein